MIRIEREKKTAVDKLSVHCSRLRNLLLTGSVCHAHRSAILLQLRLSLLPAIGVRIHRIDRILEGRREIGMRGCGVQTARMTQKLLIRDARTKRMMRAAAPCGLSRCAEEGIDRRSAR